MRDVVAFHAQRSLRHSEGFLDVGESLRPCHEVSTSPGLVQNEGILCVRGDGLGECGLLTALRYPEGHASCAAATVGPDAGEQLFELGGIRRQLRNQYFPGGRCVVVRILQHGVDESTEVEIEFFVDHPAAHTANAATSNNELLNGGGELVVCDPENVGIDVFGQNHRAFRQRGLERPELIPETSGLLELQLGRSVLHLGGQIGHVPGIVAADE